MTAITNVRGTAFVVAEFRAEENRAAFPLYRDPIVGVFLDEDSRYAAGLVEAGFPQVKDLVRMRTRYLDDRLEAELQSGVQQVVILGAGLDTRAVRKETDGVTYFEIDDADTLALKQRRYRQHGIGADVTFIPGNYVTDGLIALLVKHGFDLDAPSYFIWEGNTMYLPLVSVKDILRELQTSVKRFRVSFDYMTESVVGKTTGDPGMTRLVENFEAMGAPWLSGIRDARNLAREIGLSLLDNFTTAELIQRYCPGRVSMSAIFDFYSLCTLTSVRAQQ